MHRLILFLSAVVSIVAADPVGPALPQAHAHNDYEHERPLLDALSHGFTSVEADIHLVEGKLLVAHDPEDVQSAKTLEQLYLEPLKELAGGRKSIFGSGQTLTLLIDFKTESDETYEALKEVLARYAAMLTEFSEDRIRTNAVTVILSGNRPKEKLLAEKNRLAAFDGRLADLGQGYSISFMPLVSDNWRNHFAWNGEGAIPAEERTKLREMVQRAHSEGRRIRFWATPDRRTMWEELQAARVDLINTDDLRGLAEHLRAKK